MEPNTSPPAKQNVSDPKQQIVDRLKQAENVLVTVSSNPSVDQLAACIGLTLMLNKLGKHGTAVYSGATPSTIEFLKPEETLEKTTDSLRDFIIALDKTKADKLRYKVEDKIVQIFITPYRTSLSEKDLDFSLGDFNVDAVVALGVHQQTELDQAITAHGRILHDATIISINTTPNNDLGSINWQDNKSSSLSEMIAGLGNVLGKNVFDAQIATALLTGIVAATNRFSNDKTFSETMSISAQLISAGANQQLVATKLEEAQVSVEPPPPPPPEQPSLSPIPSSQPPAGSLASKPPEPEPQKSDDGTLLINHGPTMLAKPQKAAESEAPEDKDEGKGVTSLEDLNLNGEDKDEESEEAISQIDIDKEGVLRSLKEKEEELAKASTGEQKTIQPTQPPPGPGAIQSNRNVTGGSPLIQGPPIMAAGTLTANSQTQGLDPSTDPLSLPPVDSPMLTRDNPGNFTSPSPLLNIQPPVSAPLPQTVLPPVPPLGTLPDLEGARKAVEQVADNPNGPLKPLQALNAQPVYENMHQPPPLPGAPIPPPNDSRQILNMPMPPSSALPPADITNAGEDAPSGAPQPNPSATDPGAPGAPPPVPPPMTPQGLF